MTDSVWFFDQQFQRQVAAREHALNPFERATLMLLAGDVLDFGCGLGNQALAAAWRGCRVTALDASQTFGAPGQTLKVFSTITARKPAGEGG